MGLSSGDRLGPYEVVAPLGAGGMGEVYRARDTRLNRSVAVKVLPESVSQSAEHRVRFEREARAIAALNHPNICTVHDVGRSGEVDYLVMELIEGETLEQRLKRGPLPTAEVARIGAEIARALARAHRAGVLHRDLKPGNVMLTKTGAKLMDFGLARMTRDGAATAMSQIATQAAPITGEGKIVGTFQYMAPEQLEGHEADARSDIWALGATLYEMATGKRAFDGASTASVISAIMREEPRPLSELVPMSPPELERLVRTCLAKDPEERWQNARDLADALAWVGEGSGGSGAPEPASPSTSDRRRAFGILLGLAAIGWIVAGLLWLGQRAQREKSESTVRTQVVIGEPSALPRGEYALSPDGSSIAYTIPDSSDARRLFIRKLSESNPTGVVGVQAQSPFWSPDGRQVAFLTDEGNLVRVGVGGGSPQTVCRAPDLVSGAWGADHWIVFGTSQGPLMRVRETGGKPEPATTLDSTRRETAHQYPSFLPDGRHFTFVTLPPLGPTSFQVKVGDIEGGLGRDLMTAHHAPVIGRGGWMVFMRDRALLAQRVDRSGAHVLGEPIPMLETPERSGGLCDPIALVGGDNLLYREQDDAPRRISWITRQGSPQRDVASTPFVVGPEIAPDGSRAIMRGVQGGETWLVLVDLQTGEVRPLTSRDSWNSWPIWNATGSGLLFTSGTDDHFEVREMEPEDAKSNRVLWTSTRFNAADRALPDGHGVLVTANPAGNSFNLEVRYFADPSIAHPVLSTGAFKPCALFLHGGRQLAYASDESGRLEIYAADFPSGAHRTRLTRDGCAYSPFVRHLVWCHGDELFYLARDSQTMRALKVAWSEGEAHTVSDEPLFTLPTGCRGVCPAPDGTRFLVITSGAGAGASALKLVQNWQRGLPRAR